MDKVISIVKRLLLFGIFSFSGQVWPYVSKELVDVDIELMENIIFRVAQASTGAERKKIASIKPKVVKHWDPRLAVTYKLNGGGGEIVVSEMFLAQLHVAARAFALEIKFSLSGDIVESYIEDRNWNNEYPDRILPTLDDYVGLPTKVSQQLEHDEAFNALVAGNFVSAMTVMVMHELGHHFTNSFSLPSDPFPVVRKRETASDSWAREKMFEMGIPPIIGIVLLARIFEVYDQPELMHGNERSHPEPMKRVVAMLDGSPEDLTKQYKKGIALGIKYNQSNPIQLEVLKKTSLPQLIQAHYQVRDFALNKAQQNANKSVAYYKSMIANAETAKKPDWMYPLAHVYMRGIGTPKNMIEARRYFVLAGNSGHQWAAIWAASFYELGWGGLKDLDAAYRFFKLSAKNGHISGNSSLSAFEKRHNL